MYVREKIKNTFLIKGLVIMFFVLFLLSSRPFTLTSKAADDVEAFRKRCTETLRDHGVAVEDGVSFDVITSKINNIPNYRMLTEQAWRAKYQQEDGKKNSSHSTTRSISYSLSSLPAGYKLKWSYITYAYIDHGAVSGANGNISGGTVANANTANFYVYSYARKYEYNFRTVGIFGRDTRDCICIDLNSETGKEIGRYTWNNAGTIGATVSATHWGTDTTTNAYHPGYKFNGNYTTAVIKADGTNKVYRYFDPIRYTVRIHDNKPSNASSDIVVLETMQNSGYQYENGTYIKEYVYDGTVLEKASQLYALNGWTPSDVYWYGQGNENGKGTGTQYKAGSAQLTIEENAILDLYPDWGANQYTIIYKLNNGSHGALHPTKAVYDELFSVSNPVRKNFTFQGWDISGMDSSIHTIGDITTTESSASRTKAISFKNLHSKTTGVITFTAIWADNTPPDMLISYKNADGTPYSCGTWTGQTVIASVSATDIISGIKGIRWDGGSMQGNPSTKQFPSTGTYNGKVSATDNADIAGSDYVSATPNVTTINYGPVMVDKQKPTGVASYLVNSTWRDTASDPTKYDVTVKINAEDAHSGLHTSAYSWDGGLTWIPTDNKIFHDNTSGTVLIRDAVGNQNTVSYVITGIDRKPPTVMPTDPTDPALEPDPDGNTNYEFEEIGALAYDWVNSDMLLSFTAEDRESDDPDYPSSGIAEMNIYSADKGFNINSCVASTSSSTITYTVTTQGITYYVVEAIDEADNHTYVNVTVKIDKTAPVIPLGLGAEGHKIENIDLDNYGIDEIESKVVDTTAMKRSFLFTASDYNDTKNGKITTRSDSSGITTFTVRLINVDDETDYKDYNFGYLTDGALNTDEYSGETDIRALLTANFVDEINTFAEFPKAAALKYTVTIADRAGNKTVYQSSPGNEIKNFSIKAVLRYGAALEEDTFVDSNAKDIFNVTDLNEKGKKTNIPYFKLGDFGYVEIWTIGYVPEVQLDFLDMGKESIDEIMKGKLDSKYNMGVTYDTLYERRIKSTQGTKIATAFPDVDGIPYACHYGIIEEGSRLKELMSRFKNDGVAVRIPPYYELTKDGLKRPDGTDSYSWEVHEGLVNALKGFGTYTDTSRFKYVLWDTRVEGIHHRVTHET